MRLIISRVADGAVWIAPVHSVLIWVGGQRHLLSAQDGRHTLVGSQALRPSLAWRVRRHLARGR